jgi:hypothetical protein
LVGSSTDAIASQLASKKADYKLKSKECSQKIFFKSRTWRSLKMTKPASSGFYAEQHRKIHLAHEPFSNWLEHWLSFDR